MSLPIRTTLDDIDAVCGYLATKPTGATSSEAKAVVDKRRLDGRKLAAFKFWGLIEENGNRMKLTERGRQVVRESGAYRSSVLCEIVRDVPPYAAVVERAAHRGEDTITATEVAAHWHEHFRGEVSESEKTLNDQAVCFFQVAQGANLGTITIGRKGQPTRFEFDTDATRVFAEGSTTPSIVQRRPSVDKLPGHDQPEETVVPCDEGATIADTANWQNNRVFITHGKNSKILGQVKELVAYGKFEPVVAKEHETAAKPVPKKVMDDMRTCRAAVIHVGSEGVLFDKDGNEVHQINGNVLIEIGAAMALYGDSFILLVEEGVTLPSNLQGLFECRYEGDELNMPAAMKLLKAFNEFGTG